jgi:hypothetical protein
MSGMQLGYVASLRDRAVLVLRNGCLCMPWKSLIAFDWVVDSQALYTQCAGTPSHLQACEGGQILCDDVIACARCQASLWMIRDLHLHQETMIFMSVRVFYGWCANPLVGNLV